MTPNRITLPAGGAVSFDVAVLDDDGLESDPGTFADVELYVYDALPPGGSEVAAADYKSKSAARFAFEVDLTGVSTGKYLGQMLLTAADGQQYRSTVFEVEVVGSIL